jgi:hypothetical protein
LACHSRYQATGDAGDSRQIVDHELIAAGHPRLAFELSAYLESLPAHWDRRTDAAQHRPAFHFQTWLTGQVEDLARAAVDNKRPADFAELDCLACHHALAPDGRRKPAQLAQLARLDWPPGGLLEIQNAADLRERAALVSRCLRTAGDQGRWDAVVGGLASVRAFVRDLPDEDAAGLQEPLERLSGYLAMDSFPEELRRLRAPTIYDSPSDFNRREVQPRVDAVLRALKQLESGTAAR